MNQSFSACQNELILFFCSDTVLRRKGADGGVLCHYQFKIPRLECVSFLFSSLFFSYWKDKEAAFLSLFVTPVEVILKLV